MSSAADVFPQIASRARADAMDEGVLKAGRQLLAGGPVCFKLSSRVEAGRLPWWKRRHYVYFCREAPELLKVPPRPAQQLTVFTSFARAVRECKTPDDQILVMRFNRPNSPAEKLEAPVECRPKDQTDAARTNALAAVFAGYGGDGEDLEELREQAERVIQKCRDI